MGGVARRQCRRSLCTGRRSVFGRRRREECLAEIAITTPAEHAATVRAAAVAKRRRSIVRPPQPATSTAERLGSCCVLGRSEQGGGVRGRHSSLGDAWGLRGPSTFDLGAGYPSTCDPGHCSTGGVSVEITRSLDDSGLNRDAWRTCGPHAAAYFSQRHVPLFAHMPYAVHHSPLTHTHTPSTFSPPSIISIKQRRRRAPAEPPRGGATTTASSSTPSSGRCGRGATASSPSRSVGASRETARAQSHWLARVWLGGRDDWGKAAHPLGRQGLSGFAVAAESRLSLR